MKLFKMKFIYLEFLKITDSEYMYLILKANVYFFLDVPV